MSRAPLPASGNVVTTEGGYFSSARNIGGSGNVLTAGGAGSNLTTALNVFSNGNKLTAGGPGSLDGVVNVGGGGNTISAGGPGNLNAGFNFFGRDNLVTVGPGPLALAGSVLRNGQTVTKQNPGVAINGFRVGGTAATNSQTVTAPKAVKAAGPSR